MRYPANSLNQLTHNVIGEAIEVHRELGPGYLEALYEEALCLELNERKIAHIRQKIDQCKLQRHTDWARLH